MKEDDADIDNDIRTCFYNLVMELQYGEKFYYPSPIDWSSAPRPRELQLESAYWSEVDLLGYEVTGEDDYE